MADKKRGRPMGAKGFTKAEEDVIRLGLQNARPIPDIAKLLGRGRASVYRRIQRMTERGEIGQIVLDLGQVEGATDDSRAI